MYFLFIYLFFITLQTNGTMVDWPYIKIAYEKNIQPRWYTYYIIHMSFANEPPLRAESL